MKAIIVIEIDENHLLKETNELYDRLYGYKCELKPMPSKKVPVFDPNSASYDEEYEKRIMDEISGWNACLDEIMGEAE